MSDTPFGGSVSFELCVVVELQLAAYSVCHVSVLDGKSSLHLYNMWCTSCILYQSWVIQVKGVNKSLVSETIGVILIISVH